MVYLDINLKFNNSAMFNPGSVDLIDGHAFLSLAANLELPGSPPLFKENPESGGSVEFVVNQPKGAIAKFALVIDILTPGYSKRTRWFLQQIDTHLSLYEDANYRPAA
jgi:hypothetical protein